jgi:HSP20 family protein
MALELWRPRRGLARRGSREPLDDLFGRFFDNWLSPRVTGEAHEWEPAVDMIDRKDEIVLRADLPGLEQKDISVSVEGGVLSIRGERQEQREEKEEDYYYSERWTGGFYRALTLPPGVDADKIKATFKNGVLEVHIPKTKQASGKRVEIQAA